VLSAFALASIAVVLACSAAAAPPRVTTLDSTTRPVARVVQDGQWLARARVCGGLRVTVRHLRRGRVSSAGICGSAGGPYYDGPQFALASGRTLWNTVESGNFVYNTLLTASPGGKPRRVAELIFEIGDGTGDYLGMVAGDGPTLVFSSVRADVDPPTCDVGGGDICGLVVESGRVWRVVGAKRVAVPGTPPTFLLAAWQRRIAVVAADGVFVRRRAGRTVEVRDAVTGRLVSSSTPVGKVQALALAPTYVALLVAGPAGRRVERRYAATGALVGSTRVSSTVDRISASSRGVVFAVDRAIRLLDARTGRIRTIATARSKPVGVSIESNRVVWAERARGRTFIRALRLV
jgi:hypothetical protein